MSDARDALAVLRDYVGRSTHWTEGGATRHEALAALEKMADADELRLSQISSGAVPQWRDKMKMNKITIKHEGNDWVMRVDGDEYFRFGTKAAAEHAAAIYRRDHAYPTAYGPDGEKK